MRNVANITLETDWGALDILSDAPGAPPFDDLYRNAKLSEVQGVLVRVASVKDLIKMKRAAGRAKDELHLIESMLEPEDPTGQS